MQKRIPATNPDQPPLEEVSQLSEYLKQDSVGALLLLISAVAAVVLANSPWSEWYHHLWHIDLSLVFGDVAVNQSLHHWINDGLMAIFFFLVGLEIKRELLVGELASFRRALLPAMAAIGGMIVPALVYSIINLGAASSRGWGIPMATDIAFATGCLALLGKRVLPAMSIFLIALAIVDDLGSVLVIALFYTDRIATIPLVVGGALILISYALNRMGFRHTAPYAIIGLLVWWQFLQSGVHATVAGVLLALTIPVTARYDTPLFSGRMDTLLRRFTQAEDHANPRMVNGRQQELIRFMLQECHHVEAPLQRLEHALHPLCVFIILPLFAFSNSGVTIDFANIDELLLQRVTVGVVLGLILGKQIGITLAAWIAVKLKWAELPAGMGWKHVYGLSWIAAIGFTMALFVGELAFKPGPGGDAATMKMFLDESKVGVFIASILAGIVGLLILRASTPKPERP